MAVMGAAGEGENRDNPLLGEEVGILEQICKSTINPTIFLERICPIEILERVYERFQQIMMGEYWKRPKMSVNATLTKF